MKKSLMYAAFAALLTCLSCLKEQPSVSDTPMKSVSISPLPTETKTLFGPKGENGKYPVAWSENDAAIAVTWNSTNEWVQANRVEGNRVSFNFSAADFGSAPYTFYAVSPYSAAKSVYMTAKDGIRLNVEIPSGQATLSGGPDEAAQILYAVSEEFADLPSETVKLAFHHIPAYLCLSFTNVNNPGGTGANLLDEGESVQSVTLSYDGLEAFYLSGRMFYFPKDKRTESNAVVKGLTVTTDRLDNVWCGVAPMDISGKTITFTVATDKRSFTAEKTFPASGYTLASGQVSKLKVNMKDATKEDGVDTYERVLKPDQLSADDKIIILNRNGLDEGDYALSAQQNANNRAATALVRDEGVVSAPGFAVQPIVLEAGNKTDEYALQVGTGNYLCFESGGNYLRTTDNKAQNTASWDIQFSEYGNAILRETMDNREIRFNTNGLFSAYTHSENETSGTKFVQIYKRNLTPSFAASMAADGTSVAYSAATFPIYVTGNVPWTASVSATGGSGATLAKKCIGQTAGSASLSGTGATILELAVPANETDADITYTVTISTTESVSPASYTFTLTQQFAPSTFPILWSFPSPNSNVEGTDYYLNDISGSWVYSDTHEGKLTVIRPSPAEKPGKEENHTTYQKRSTSSEPRWNGKHCLLHYGIYKEDYWLFEAYRVDNPAGTYTLNYCVESSAAGPKYFLLEYSTDGENWTSINPQSGSFSTDGEFYYTYAISPEGTVQTVNETFNPGAVHGTLAVRARVVSVCRADKNSQTDMTSRNHGGTNRIGDHITLSFAADE